MAEDVALVSAADYDALRSGAALVNRSDRGRWRFTGEKAAETLTGLVTNDVSALKPCEGLYAAALTPKGKIVADLRIFCESDGFLADTGAAAAPGWRAMSRKFINPRVAPFTEISEQTRDIGVFGAGAAELLARVLEDGGSAHSQLSRYSHFRARFTGGVEATLIRAMDLGDIPGFDIVVPAESEEALRGQLLALGALPVSSGVLDVARIEAGIPEWGVDMNEDTLPQEANLDDLDAISYSKGCYVGQEIVARIHFRGHVNKMLRRVTFDGEQMPPRGTELVDESGKAVGDIRSSALSPRLGGVGIAMVRREISPGGKLVARWENVTAGVAVA